MIADVFFAILVVAMLAVIYFDATQFIIPNWLNAALLLLYPLWWCLSPIPLDGLMALACFGLLLLIGFIIFQFGIMGGGDVKLLAVLGLYTNWSMSTVTLIFYTAILGGVLAMLLIILRRLLPAKNKPKLFTKGEPVPYGLAIVGAFLTLLLSARVPGFTKLDFIFLL